MKTKQRLTMIESDYKHIDSTLEKLVDKFDKLQRNFYLAMGGFMVLQFLISNEIIKIG